MTDQEITEAAEKLCWKRWGGVNREALMAAVVEGIRDGERVKIDRHDTIFRSSWTTREGADLVAYTDVAEVGRLTLGTPVGDSAYAEVLIAKAARAGRPHIPSIG